MRRWQSGQMQLAVNQSASACGGSNPSRRTIEEIASFEGSPRFTRRLIRIQFWGQKRIGDFAF